MQVPPAPRPNGAVAAMVVMVSDALLVLVNVTVWLELAAFTPTVPKLSDPGVTETLGATPVPMRATVVGVLDAPSDGVKEADSAPAVVGVKVTE